MNDRSIRVRASVVEGDDMQQILIACAHVVDDVVFYEIEVANSSLRWNVFKRFSEFYSLDLQMREIFERLYDEEDDLIWMPALPARAVKLFVDHLNPDFIEARRVLLQNYLRELLKMPLLSMSEFFFQFLSPESNENNYLPGKIQSSHRPSAATLDAEVITTEKKDDFSSRSASETELDDDLREVTHVTVKQAKVHGHGVMYHIYVCNMNLRRSFQEWMVLKTYAQFYQLHQNLKEELSYEHLADLPELPPRQPKLIIDHNDPNFIENRRVLLDNYLKRLITHPEIVYNPCLLGFLGAEVGFL